MVQAAGNPHHSPALGQAKARPCGVYTARVPRGEKVVLVLGNKLVGEEPLYEEVPASPTRNKYEMITPEAYNAKHLSPLRVNISEPRDNLDFELSGDIPAP